MGITFNRQPTGVSIPSSSDVKQYYFNHCNWKGINQNRNFLNVDQETFADAENVYVDEHGLLKSRLPFKFRRRFMNKIIKDVSVFDNVLVVVYQTGDNWYIGIIKDDDWALAYQIMADVPLKIFRNGDYIYIFTNKGFLTYNVDNNTVEETKMYDAITRVYSGESFNSFEDENLFSKYNRYQYLLFPTLPSEDGEYLSNGISSNAFGRIGNYSHFINEHKIFHELMIDNNFDFLKVIHQPLLDTAEGFKVVNCYHKEVNTTLIYNNFIFRWYNNRLQRASLSDRIFETMYDFNEGDNKQNQDDFVKIKIGTSDEILIIYKNSLIVFNNLGEYKSVMGFADGLIDYDAVFVNGERYYSYIGYENDVNPETEQILSRSLCVFCRIPSAKKGSKIILNKVTNGDEITPNQYNSDLRYSKNTLYGEFAWLYCVFYLDFDVGHERNYVIDTFRCIDNSVLGFNWRFGEISKISTSNMIYDEYNYKFRSNLTTDLIPPFYDYDFSVVNNQRAGAKILFAYGDYQCGDILVYGEFNNEISVNNEYGYSYAYNGSLFIKKLDGLYLLNSNDEEIKITDLDGDFTVPSNSDYWFYTLKNENITVSNYRLSIQTINVKFAKESEISDLDLIVKSSKIYASKDNNLYIGDIIIDPDDDNHKLYFKKSDSHILDENIDGIHQISDNEIAIFTTAGTWYNTLSDDMYYYVKSKIVPTLKGKSNLITLPDSTTTLMPSDTGIIALNYQNFVNTTEQSTINLTQDLNSIYALLTSDILSITWKFYTIFYSIGGRNLILYDTRLFSWWRWNLPKSIDKLFVYKGVLSCLCDGAIYEFSDDLEYCDNLESEKRNIEWFIESQKLHLNANNYYKHISNLTLTSTQESLNPIHLNLNVKNYRKWVDNGKAENFDYQIDIIRTYVKRLNYAKVCEFQYRISSDNLNAINIPLSLSNITIKYKIGGQVR